MELTLEPGLWMSVSVAFHHGLCCCCLQKLEQQHQQLQDLSQSVRDESSVAGDVVSTQADAPQEAAQTHFQVGSRV